MRQNSCSGNAGERETLRRAIRRSGLIQSGCGEGSFPNPPVGRETKAILANRVQGSIGSRNTRWRREPGGRKTDQPEGDILRGSAEKADREQLNDERGVKPLPVSRGGDDSRTGETSSGWVREQLLYSGP